MILSGEFRQWKRIDFPAHPQRHGLLVSRHKLRLNCASCCVLPGAQLGDLGMQTGGNKENGGRKKYAKNHDDTLFVIVHDDKQKEY